MSFQLTSISGKLPTLKDKKIHNLSLTRVERKRKLLMEEPIETVIIRGKQNFKIVGRLDPIQIKNEDDRVVIILKRYKNVMYKLTPLGILFPALIKNNTGQIFITCTKLNDVKQALINSQIYGLLGIIDLSKNW